MDVHHIRYFLAICNTLNFTRAAEACNVTQPALSRAIQELELEVGGLLFRRERNLTHITDLGLLMKPRFENIAAAFGQVKRDARQFCAAERTGVTVGMMCTVGPTRFSSMLSHFCGHSQGVNVNMVEGTPSKLLSLLDSSDIDVAILAQPERFPENISARLLYRERFLVAFPIGHRFAQLETVRLADLNGESYLSRVSCEYNSHIDNKLAEIECSVNVVYESEREDWIQNMVASGLGVNLIPEFSATIPGLQTRPIAEPEICREICVAAAEDRAIPPAATQFVGALTQFPWPQSRYPCTNEAA